MNLFVFAHLRQHQFAKLKPNGDNLPIQEIFLKKKKKHLIPINVGANLSLTLKKRDKLIDF